MNKRVRRIFVIAVILILIAVIAGAVCVFVANNKENGTPNNTENNQELPPPEENVIEEEFVEVLDNGIKMNISTKLKEKKVVNGLEIDEIKFFMSNGQTYLRAKVKNNSGKDIEATGVDIILYDKEGNELSRMGGVIDPMKNGETKDFESITTLDFSNAYDFKVEIM